MSVKSRLRNVSYLTLSSVLFMLSGYIINIWLARTLGPDDYGIYGIVVGLMTLINLVQLSGLPQATSKFIAENKISSEEILAASLKIQIILGVILTLLFFVFSPLIGYTLNDNSIISLIALTSLVFIPNGIFSLYLSYYNGLENFRKQAIANIIYSLSKTIFVISFTLITHLKGAIIGFILAAVTGLIYAFHIPRKNNKDFPYIKLITFAIPLLILSLLGAIQTSIDLFFIKSMTANENSVGIYAAVQNIARIPFLTLNAFALIIFPTVTSFIAQKQFDKARKEVEIGIRYITIILLPLGTLVITFSYAVIEFLYGSAYTRGSSVLSILVVSFVAFTYFTYLCSVLNGLGKPHFSWIACAIGILASITGYILLIPSHTLIGAAIATNIGGIISTMIAFMLIKQILHIHFPLLTLLKVTVACIIIAFIGTSTNTTGVGLVFWCILLFAIYLLILFFMNAMTDEELSKFKKLVKPKMNRYIK